MIDPNNALIWQLMTRLPGWIPPTEATVLQALARGEAKIPFYTSIGREGAIAIVRVGNVPDAEFWEELGEYLKEFLLPAIKRRRERIAERAASVPSESEIAPPDGG